MSVSLERFSLSGSSPLCDLCRSMTSTLSGLTALSSKEGYLHMDLNRISQSAFNGCRLCRMLQGIYQEQGHTSRMFQVRIYVDDDDEKNIGRKPRAETYMFEIEEVNSDTLDFRTNTACHSLEFTKLRICLERFNPSTSWHAKPILESYLYVFTTAGDPADRFLDIDTITIPVAGDIFTRKVLARLHECHSLHEKCPNFQKTDLPTRVIDVGPKGCRKPLIRLYKSASGEKGHYLALSYRWGGPQNSITTGANFKERESGFHIASLPKTLREAIFLTRELGFSYLWIDSLCIIQDSGTDQAVEVSNMGKIFKNSISTIAAANTPNADSSFLEDRSLPINHCAVPYLLPDGKLGTMYIKKNASTCWLSGPLDSRAWALQEFLLSPRLLYYSPGDLIWRCQTTAFDRVHETHSDEPRYKMKTGLPLLPSGILGVKRKQQHTKEKGEADESLPRAETWRRIVNDYSHRSLTIEQDRLPALAGIASEIHAIWDDQYLAGLWRSLLPYHLAWSITDSNGGAPKLIIPNKSPSWSWSSIQRGVRLGQLVDARVEVLDCQITLLDQNAPFSGVKEGRLTLRGKCVQGLHRELRSSNLKFFWDQGQDVKIDNIPKDILYMCIGYREFGGYEGLILAPVNGGLDRIYRRVGAVSTFNRLDADWPAWSTEREVVII